jgi:hypothetical protein
MAKASEYENRRVIPLESTPDDKIGQSPVSQSPVSRPDIVPSLKAASTITTGASPKRERHEEPIHSVVQEATKQGNAGHAAQKTVEISYDGDPQAAKKSESSTASDTSPAMLSPKKLQKELFSELEQGIISTNAIETFKIAVPAGESRYHVENPKQDEFSNYMQGITTRLLSSQFAQQHLVKGEPIPQFKFFISDEEANVNAGIITDADPPLVVVTKELLQRVARDGREDVLAGIMAHELTHYYLSPYRKTISKVEESVAYGLPTFLLYHAEYQYTGMREVFGLRDDSGRMDELTKYADVHPGCKLSERIAEDSEGILAQYLRRQHKDFQGIPLAEPTPFPEEIGQLAEEFTFVDVINSEFREAGFKPTPYTDEEEKTVEDAQTTKQKLQFIKDNMDRWLDVGGQELGNVARHERVNALNKLLHTCLDNQGVSLQITLEDKIPLLDKILVSELPIETGSLTFQKPEIEKDGIFFPSRKFQRPPKTGILHDVAESFDALFALTQLPQEQVDNVEAAERSSRLIETISRIHPEHRDVLNLFYFGEVANRESLEKQIKNRNSNHLAMSLGIPDGITPPWDGLIQTAIDHYHQTGQSSIAEALLVMGINDPRLATVPAHNPITITHNGQQENTFSYMDAGFPRLRINSQGEILGTAHAISDFAVETRLGANLSTRRLRVFRAGRMQAVELQAVESSLMEGLQQLQTPEDLNKLLWLYPQHLTTPNYPMGGEMNEEDNTPIGSKAAALLTQRLESLAKEDPDVWVPVIKALFSERYKSKFANDQQTSLAMSVHDVQQRLRNHSLDSPLSASQNHFRDLDNPFKEELVPILLPDEMGMPLNHPYVQFVLRHTENMTMDDNEIYFSKEQALSLLDKTVVTHVRTPEGEDISPPTTLNPEIYFQLLGVDGFAQTDTQLSQRLASLRKIDPSITWVSGYNPKPDSENWSSRFLLLHARNEIYNYLTTHPSAYLSPEAFEESLKAIKTTIGGAFWQEDFKTGRAFIPEITELLRQQFITNADEDRKNEQTDPLTLARMYTVFEKYGFFQRYPDYRWDEDKGYDPLIYQQLQSFQEGHVDPSMIRNFTETMLYGCSVQSPELRNELIAAWGEAIKLQYGVDRTNAFDDMAQHAELDGYYTAITTVVDEVIAKTPKGLLHESMLHTLANSLETQSSLTRHIFTQSERVSKEQLLKSTEGKKGPLAEFGLDLIIANDQTRLATIDFLTGTLTEEALESFVGVIEKRFTRGTYNSKDNASAFVQSPMDEFFSKVLENADFDFKDPKIRERIKGKLRASYDNFWDARIEQRAYYMNLLAFPEKSSGNDKKDKPEFQVLVDYVIDKVLPYDDQQSPDSSFNKYTTFGRDLVLSYLDDATHAEQRLLLSGLMVSARKMGEANDRDETTIGKALALTLMNMGPAGTKLAQAIHSYPQTPEPIRNGMEGVKGEANIPTRQEVFNRMEEVITAQNGADRITLAGIEHVGPVLGAGAYQYALQTRLHEAIQGYDELALTLLRDHVYTFAQNEFRHIQHAFDGFVQRRTNAGDAVTLSTVQAMRHVIDQASTSSILETDYDVGKIQSDLLYKQYDGLTVQTANRTIAFKTVTWLDHGISITQSSEGDSVQAYKAANIAPGRPFNTFSKTATPEELRDLGIALQITEDMMTLSGKHFDHDRHGDNFNVLRVKKEMQIGNVILKPGDLLVMHYDLGAVNIDPPTSQEKEEIGEILAATLQTVLSEEGDIKSTLLNQITERLGQKNRDSSYLSAVLRGLLARGDFLRNLTQDDIQTAAVALFNSGTIDDEIASSLLVALTTQENGNVEQLLQFLTNGSSQINIHLPEAMKKNNP